MVTGGGRGRDASPSGDPGSGHVLVEREQELDLLRGVVADLVSGTPRTVLLRGPGGVGRSALLRWIRPHAETAGCQVLVGRCTRSAAATRFGLVSQLNLDDRGETEGLPVRLRAALLERAARRPVLVLLDDVQWIDPASEHWLRMMVTRPAHPAVTLVFAVTDPFGQGWQEYSIHSLPAAMTTHRLRPLSEPAVLSMLRARTGRAVDPRIGRAVADSASGRPALVHDIAALVGTDSSSRGAAELARRHADADRAAALVFGLPGELADLVRVLALEPGDLDFELVCALAGLRTMSPASALELVRGLEFGAGATPLAHDAPAAERILAGMDASGREDLYARAATIAHRSALSDSEVARLLLRARPIGEQWAVETLCREAAQARGVGEFGVAVTLLTRALREPLDDMRRGRLEVDLAIASTPDSPVAGERLLRRVLLRTGGPDLSQVRLDAADLLVAGGDDVQVRSTLGAVCGRAGVAPPERAVLSALCWIADDAPHEGAELSLPASAAPPERPDGPIQAGVVAWRLAVRGVDLPATRVLAMTALEDETRLVTPKVLVCRTLMLTDDSAEAMAGLGRAIALAQDRGAGVLSAVAHLARGRAHTRNGRFEEAAADIEAALVHMPRRCWHPMTLPSVVAAEAALAIETGHLSRAESLLDVEWEPRVRRGFGWAQVLLTKGLIDLYRGRPADAVTHLRECGRRLLARGWTNPALLAWRTLTAIALRALGKQEEAEILVTEELRLARTWGARTTVGGAHLGASLVLTGVEAEQHCAEAVRLLRGSAWRFRYGQALVALAGHRVSSGAIGDALDLLRESDQLAGEFGSRQFTEGMRGTAARIGNLLSATERRITGLVACGLSNTDIAAQLAITRRTVEGHLSAIYRKTGVTRRHQLRALLELAVVEECDRDDAGA